MKITINIDDKPIYSNTINHDNCSASNSAEMQKIIDHNVRLQRALENIDRESQLHKQNAVELRVCHSNVKHELEELRKRFQEHYDKTILNNEVVARVVRRILKRNKNIDCEKELFKIARILDVNITKKK